MSKDRTQSGQGAIIIRQARPEDAVVAAELLLLTAEPLLRYLFYGDRSRTLRVLGELFAMRRNEFTYEDTYLAEVDSQVAGLIRFTNKRKARADNRGIVSRMIRVMPLLHILGRVPRYVHLAWAFAAIGDDAAYIHFLATSPFFRRQGVARRLLASCEGWAREIGLLELALDVEAHNEAARALYEAAGFRESRTLDSSALQRAFGFSGVHRMVKRLA